MFLLRCVLNDVMMFFGGSDNGLNVNNKRKMNVSTTIDFTSNLLSSLFVYFPLLSSSSSLDTHLFFMM